MSDYVREHPKTAALVVEVAVSSPELDRENAALYAENGVAEYWIVLAKEKAIEMYRKPQDGNYLEKQVIASGDTLECASAPGVRVNLAELFAAA